VRKIADSKNEVRTPKDIFVAIIMSAANVGIGYLSWQGQNLQHPLKMLWAMFSAVPFAIAFFVKSYGHEIDFAAYYLMIFLQWFLLTLAFFALIRKIRKTR
jgi:hypothetical protein